MSPVDLLSSLARQVHDAKTMHDEAKREEHAKLDGLTRAGVSAREYRRAEEHLQACERLLRRALWRYFEESEKARAAA